jgi:hypothetical protein
MTRKRLKWRLNRTLKIYRTITTTPTRWCCVFTAVHLSTQFCTGTRYVRIVSGNRKV